jgi:hypothetical protein
MHVSRREDRAGNLSRNGGRPRYRVGFSRATRTTGGAGLTLPNASCTFWTRGVARSDVRRHSRRSPKVSETGEAESLDTEEKRQGYRRLARKTRNIGAEPPTVTKADAIPVVTL